MKKIIRLTGTLLTLLAMTACQKAEILLSKEDGENVINEIAANVSNNMPKALLSRDASTSTIEYLTNDVKTLDNVKKTTNSDISEIRIDLNNKIKYASYVTETVNEYFDGSKETTRHVENIWEYFENEQIIQATEVLDLVKDGNYVKQTKLNYRKDIPDFDDYLKYSVEELAIINKRTVSKDFLEILRDYYFVTTCGIYTIDDTKVKVEVDKFKYSTKGSYKNSFFSFNNDVTFDAEAITDSGLFEDLSNVGTSDYTASYALTVKDGFYGDVLSKGVCTTKTKDGKDLAKTTFQNNVVISKPDAMVKKPNLENFQKQN